MVSGLDHGLYAQTGQQGNPQPKVMVIFNKIYLILRSKVVIKVVSSTVFLFLSIWNALSFDIISEEIFKQTVWEY